MKSHELDIVIDEHGNISIQVNGVSGPQCVDLTKDLEAALGVVTEQKKTGAYYEDSVSETVEISLEDE
jgi:hypothetical protein